MRPGGLSVSIACAVLLLFLPAGPVAWANPLSASPTPAESTAEAVEFDADLLPLGSLTVAFQFGGQSTLSGGSIQPSQSVNATASLSLPSMINLSITYNGVGTSVPVAPVGNSFEVGVPGLGLTFLGYGLGVFLNFSSEVTAISSVSGPGTGGGGDLAWSSSGTKEFSITANSSAPYGGVIDSTLSSISYSISMGLVAGANIPVIGNYGYTILDFGQIGLVKGSPSTVSAEYVLPSAPPAGGGFFSGGAASPGAILLALGIFIAIAVVAAAAYLLGRKRRG